jgi:hypothetical protein
MVSQTTHQAPPLASSEMNQSSPTAPAAAVPAAATAGGGAAGAPWPQQQNFPPMMMYPPWHPGMGGGMMPPPPQLQSPPVMGGMYYPPGMAGMPAAAPPPGMFQGYPPSQQQHATAMMPTTLQSPPQLSSVANYNQKTPEVVHKSSQYLPGHPKYDAIMNDFFSPTNKKKRRRKQNSITSPKGVQSTDDEYAKALAFLRKRADETPLLPSAPADVKLIEEGDSNLLTDYFHFIMQQLAVCRLSEQDRKTRGGKRQDVAVGYGGLQCIHCASAPSSRKFFWSNVDRLANSFAGIPDHVLTCKLCPEEVTEALLVLKGRHNDQMTLLPRGTQKQFFRRMWRRLHAGDDEAAAAVRDDEAAEEEEEEAAAATVSSLKRDGHPDSEDQVDTKRMRT